MSTRIRLDWNENNSEPEPYKYFIGYPSTIIQVENSVNNFFIWIARTSNKYRELINEKT